MSETRECIRCGENYKPKYYELLGIKILRGGVGFPKRGGYCPKCANEVYEEDMAKEKAARELEVKKTRLERIRMSGIPPKFQATTFESFDGGSQDKPKGYCEKYAQIFPIDQRPIGYPSLYLWSAKTWGVGKTHLSCAIALRILSRWSTPETLCPRISFVKEYDLFRKIQATFNYNREERELKDSEDKIMSRLLSCELLILDDVGKQTTARPDFVQRILFTLIDERYDKRLPIILTANVNTNGLRRHMGDASLDRFFEMTGGKSVCMEGESYRRKNDRR